MDAAERLAVLMDRIEVATPCGMEWGAMKGDAEKRFCGSCRKHVYNLNAMKPEDALALLGDGEQETCVRVRKRADQTVVEGDCPAGVRKRWNRYATAGIVLLAPVLLIGCSVATLIQNPKSFTESKFGHYVSENYTKLKVWLKIEKPAPPPKPVGWTMGCLSLRREI